MALSTIFRETTCRFVIVQLEVEVRDDGLYVQLRPVQRLSRHEPVADIEEAAVTDDSPATYAGWHWGMRSTPGGNAAYRLSGDRGVEVTRGDGRKLFIGSRRPDELHAAIRQVR